MIEVHEAVTVLELILAEPNLSDAYRDGVTKAVVMLNRQHDFIGEFIAGEDPDHRGRKAWETQSEIIVKQAARIEEQDERIDGLLANNRQQAEQFTTDEQEARITELEQEVETLNCELKESDPRE